VQEPTQIETGLDRDGILMISLNRPEKLNAFTSVMRRELISALDWADADDEVRVVVVTGNGRGFCAGADLRGRTEFSSSSAEERPRDGGGLLSLRIFRCLKPVIAAINGPAVGVGATMTLPMDVRLASDSACFAFPFGRRGIVLDAASSWFLPRLVPMGKAQEWTLTGRIVDADEARAAGLVSSVVPAADLLPSAIELAREIAEHNAPVSTALNRRMLWHMSGAAHPMQAHRLDSALIARLGRQPDSVEGVRSFVEKRRPHFPGQVSTGIGDQPWWDEPPFVPEAGSP
jgi:enoyl-CoA hydratase/carnithine racemase